MIPFPNKKYNIILADCPWSCWTSGWKNAARHYQCQPIDWIQKLPVAEIAADSCALFLWATFPMLPQCLETITRWGFRYATNAFTWVKRNKKSDSYFFGCGNYTRANAEVCLLGIKGTMVRQDRSVPQIIDARIMEHSRKPDEVHDRIVRLFGDLPRIELFARRRTEGWDAWGNEV